MIRATQTIWWLHRIKAGSGKRGTWKTWECYEEVGKTEEKLKNKVEDLKAKVNFLRLVSAGSGGTIAISRSNTLAFSDVVLIASGSTNSASSVQFSLRPYPSGCPGMFLCSSTPVSVAFSFYVALHQFLNSSAEIVKTVM
ncbi:unnamed protein product [Fraxinus pennsylvanica]|uniref:Uncharacterized protein n=1 Tax=Fraxinus pennsylvanica TaxID=56036 RepID=A0AAD2EBU0_9LAMI|nr:unnamed protein product [Fraxinus pennsylvanica]